MLKGLSYITLRTILVVLLSGPRSFRNDLLLVSDREEILNAPTRVLCESCTPKLSTLKVVMVDDLKPNTGAWCQH